MLYLKIWHVCIVSVCSLHMIVNFIVGSIDMTTIFWYCWVSVHFFVPVSLCLHLIRIGLLKYHFLFCITHTMCYTGLIGRSPSADVCRSMCSYFGDISTLCGSVTMRCLSENRAIHVYTYCLVSPGIMVTQIYHC